MYNGRGGTCLRGCSFALILLRLPGRYRASVYLPAAHAYRVEIHRITQDRYYNCGNANSRNSNNTDVQQKCAPQETPCRTPPPFLRVSRLRMPGLIGAVSCNCSMAGASMHDTMICRTDSGVLFRTARASPYQY